MRDMPCMVRVDERKHIASGVTTEACAWVGMNRDGVRMRKSIELSSEVVAVIPPNRLVQTVGPPKKLSLKVHVSNTIESDIQVDRQEVLFERIRGFISCRNILKNINSKCNDFLNENDNFAITITGTRAEGLYFVLNGHIVEVCLFRSVGYSFTPQYFWAYRLWTESTVKELWSAAMDGLDDSYSFHTLKLATNDTLSDGDLMQKFSASEYVCEIVSN